MNKEPPNFYNPISPKEKVEKRKGEVKATAIYFPVLHRKV